MGRDTVKYRFMDEILLHRFEDAIAARTGIRLRPRERVALRDALAARLAAVHLSRADEYYRFLNTVGADQEGEWDQLIARLTNNESYFFRDKGQMSLLRERILPEIIARNQSRRSLRLWSAGCSTGEEAYSLAMLVDELLPQRQGTGTSGWEILILGTDIDEPALQKARLGVYGLWSFRAMDVMRRNRYFQAHQDGWQINEAIRARVKFTRCNLVGDAFPSNSTGIHDIDLLLCRNVFIYFEPQAIAQVLPKFTQALRENGCLMTGHAEIQGQQVPSLQTRMYPESVVYQRSKTVAQSVITTVPAQRSGVATILKVSTEAKTTDRVDRSSPTPLSANNPHATLTASSAIPPPDRVRLSERVAPRITEDLLAEAERHFAAEEYQRVVQLLSPALETPDNKQACLLLAHAHANLGHYQAAIGCCETITKSHPFAAEPYELLAFIAQEQGQYDEAKLLLKKALYLNSAAPAPYLELAALYQREGDEERAHTMYRTAVELLTKMPAEARVGSYGGRTAQEWLSYLTPLLKGEEDDR